MLIACLQFLACDPTRIHKCLGGGLLPLMVLSNLLHNLDNVWKTRYQFAESAALVLIECENNVGILKYLNGIYTKAKELEDSYNFSFQNPNNSLAKQKKFSFHLVVLMAVVNSVFRGRVPSGPVFH